MAEISIGISESIDPDGTRRLDVWRSIDGRKEQLRIELRDDQKWVPVEQSATPSATPASDAIKAAGIAPPVIR